MNKVYNKDCLKFMRQMPDEEVDLVFADPPLPFDEDYYKFNNMDYNKWCSKWITEGWRILKQNGYFVVMTAPYLIDNNNIKKEMDKYGFKRYFIVWNNNLFDLDNKILTEEPILCYSRNRGALSELKWSGFSKTEVDYYKKLIKEEKVFCKSFIPISLATNIINKFSKQNNLIYDMFYGSGIFSRVANNMGRKYVATEINKSYL